MDSALQHEEAMFYAALEVSDPTARELFLEQACKDDVRLRMAVNELLAAHDEADQFFARSGAALQPPEADNWSAVLDGIEGEVLGTVIGPYKLIQRLGEGGCGVVYMAEQEKPVRRRVALKIIKLGMDTKKVIARFEAEQQALALMDHPNIARVLDAGVTSQGRPYFVMDLVRGVKITEFCDEHELDTRQRLKLFIEVCQAIQHAHQKGVIHRDIKPSNILVAMHDGVPVPKVIDFGIAKAIEGRLTDSTIYTPSDQFVGTPTYMSPEQAEMSGLDVDTRSDVYSLGVLLYELLTGKTPFDTKDLIKSGVEGMRRTLRDQEPQKPSVILTTLEGSARLQTARCRHSDPLKLVSLVRGDLDWIVLRAMEKDRGRRYETVNGLTMDVQRFLKNEPVIARPPSRLYRLNKLIRRNWLVFAAGAVVILALVGGFGISIWMYFKARAAERQQMQLRLQAEDRMKVSQAAFLISQENFSKADELVQTVTNFQPSLEAENVLRSLGSWHAIRQQWNLAADRFHSLLEVDQGDFSDQICLDLLAAGSLFIEREDLPGFYQFRQKAIARFRNTKDPVTASRILKLGLLTPADARTLKQLEPMADLAANSLKGHAETNSILAAWRCLSLSLMAYRQGDFVATKKWGERSQSYSTEALALSATIHVIQAMACHQLGEEAQSRSELAQGRKIIEEWFAGGLTSIGYKEGFWYDWLSARSLLHEAEELIETPPPGRT